MSSQDLLRGLYEIWPRLTYLKPKLPLIHKRTIIKQWKRDTKGNSVSAQAAWASHWKWRLLQLPQPTLNHSILYGQYLSSTVQNILHEWNIQYITFNVCCIHFSLHKTYAWLGCRVLCCWIVLHYTLYINSCFYYFYHPIHINEGRLKKINTSLHKTHPSS